MRKRPLCAAVLLLFILLRILPAGICFREPDPGGFPKALRGEIYRIEPWEQGTAVYLKDSNLSYAGGVLVYLKTKSAYSVGSTIQITGNITYKIPQGPANLGQFDARLYYQTKGIGLLCYAAEAKELISGGKGFSKLLESVRRELGGRCDVLFGEKAPILRAVLLGERAGLSGETKELYQKSGMAHLLSISGLHVSLVGMGLYRLLRRLGGSCRGAGAWASGAVLFYGSLTGMGTSTIRAVLMFLLTIGADVLGKSYDMLTALSAAALLLLLEQPLYARDASFLLSFGAVLGIGLFYPVWQSLFPLRKKWLQGLFVSLSVQILTFPLILSFYYEIPLYSLALNLLAVPLMGLLMPAGLISLAFSFLFWPAAALPALLCQAILSCYSLGADFSLSLPGSVQILGKPEGWQVFFYYFLLALFLMLSPRLSAVRRRLVFCGLMLVLPFLCVFHLRRGLTFTMLDAGQGESLFLRTAGGTTLLIDGGSSSLQEVGRQRIIPFLKAEGVRRLDYAAVTHTDGDHISGLRELLALSGRPGEVRIGALLLTAAGEESQAGMELKALAKERGIPVRRIQAGDRIWDGETMISCLYPEKGGEYGDTNEASLVLRITYGDFSLVLTGDLGEEGEKRILEQGGGERCSVLKAGHHGSKGSTCEEWLSALRPGLTLISCGESNSYGHPHQETLARLEAVKSRVLMTAEGGALTIRSDGRTYQAACFRRDGN